MFSLSNWLTDKRADELNCIDFVLSSVGMQITVQQWMSMRAIVALIEYEHFYTDFHRSVKLTRRVASTTFRPMRRIVKKSLGLHVIALHAGCRRPDFSTCS
jgi:hypothetical protein